MSVIYFTSLTNAIDLESEVYSLLPGSDNPQERIQFLKQEINSLLGRVEAIDGELELLNGKFPVLKTGEATKAIPRSPD